MAKLRIVVVDVTAVKKRHLLTELRLAIRLLTVSPAKGAETVFRQRSPVVNLNVASSSRRTGLRPVAALTSGANGVESAHQVGMAEDSIARVGFAGCTAPVPAG